MQHSTPLLYSTLYTFFLTCISHFQLAGVVCLAVMAAAAPQVTNPPIPILRAENNHNNDGSYNYA